MTEIAIIPNITGYQLKLKEKQQIFAEHFLIPSKCVFKIDADSI